MGTAGWCVMLAATAATKCHHTTSFLITQGMYITLQWTGPEAEQRQPEKTGRTLQRWHRGFLEIQVCMVPRGASSWGLPPHQAAYAWPTHTLGSP